MRTVLKYHIINCKLLLPNENILFYSVKASEWFSPQAIAIILVEPKNFIYLGSSKSYQFPWPN